MLEDTEHAPDAMGIGSAYAEFHRQWRADPGKFSCRGQNGNGRSQIAGESIQENHLV